MYSIRYVLIVSLVFHSLYLFSVFDIYFKSPLVRGVEPVVPPEPDPTADGGSAGQLADRLVLFVADGLRADKLFEVTDNDGVRAPFLRERVLRRRPSSPDDRGKLLGPGGACWGVSHTRVPTESRPGHVAVIAGFYEDVSAVTKGWKENPVEFDSLFNRSRQTFSFGSPDILPMFGAHVEHVHMDMYSAEAEDFASNSTALDSWVFDKVEQLFTSAAANATLDRQLRRDKTVFFLHLLGLDTAGHAKRPYSRDYLGNIGFVDAGVRRTVELFDRFYGHDGRTAFVFTADHGMSDKGSHGDGERANTETPLLCWGAGVATDRPAAAAAGLHPPSPPPSNWQIASDSVGCGQRMDVEQADIAPLMAILLGLPIPVNSVGVLPARYLAASAEFQARALLTNAQVLLAQLRAKEADIRVSSVGPFKPYPGIPASHGDDDSRAASTDPATAAVVDHLNGGRWLDASQSARALIDRCLKGLHYYQTYDWPLLMTVVTLGYIGWILFAALHGFGHGLAEAAASAEASGGRQSRVSAKLHTIRFEISSSTSSVHVRWLVVGLAVAYGLLMTQRPPVSYYAYVFFPCYFWTGVATVLWPVVIQLWHTASARPLWATVTALFCTLVLETSVAGYFERRLFGVALMLMVLWDVGTTGGGGQASVQAPRRSSGGPRGPGWTLLDVVWILSTLVASLFTCASPQPGDLPHVVALGSCAAVVALALAFVLGRPLLATDNQGRAFWSWSGWLVAAAHLLLSGFVVIDTASRLEANEGLPLMNQYWAWLTLVVAVASPFILPYYSPSVPGHGQSGRDAAIRRLLLVVVPMLGPFIMLSIAYEVVFFSALLTSLFAWVVSSASDGSTSNSSNNNNNNNNNNKITNNAVSRLSGPSDISLALSYLLYCYVSFFGTGNIASISSFEISSTYRFTTVFAPFLMGALLLWKIFTPFIFVAASFVAILRMTGRSPGPLFLLVIAMSDVMTVNFFFLVQDQGSWLDIGVSLSHFAMSNFMIVFQIMLFSVTALLFRGDLLFSLSSTSSSKSKVK